MQSNWETELRGNTCEWKQKHSQYSQILTKKREDMFFVCFDTISACNLKEKKIYVTLVVIACIVSGVLCVKT